MPTCARCAAAPVAPAATDGCMNDETRKRWVFFGIMPSIFLAAIESTVVATAMPTVVTHLGGIRIYSWVFSGFLLTQTVTMPLWGRFSDLYGRRPVYLAGLTIFLAGSALSGAAQDMVQLIVFRMVQGLGAGALMTLGYTIIAELFGLERRAKMQGYISSVWGLASLIGPWVGGLLTDHVSWRWVFYINLPFGAIAIAVIATALTGLPRPARRPVVDWAGVALFLQSVTGATATGAGLVLTPFVLGWVVTSVLSARLVLRISYRSVVLAGMACLTAAFLLFTRWSVTLTPGGAIWDVLLAGVGMGLVVVPMLIAVQSAVTRSDLGAATSMTQFFMSIGGALGLSIMGAVMSQRLHAGLPMVEALHGVFVVGGAVCVAALAATVLVPSGRAQDLARAEMRGEPTRVGG